MEEKVLISKSEYDKLQRQTDWLMCLEGAGVDNWQGFDEAVDMLKEIYPEDWEEIL